MNRYGKPRLMNGPAHAQSTKPVLWSRIRIHLDPHSTTVYSGENISGHRAHILAVYDLRKRKVCAGFGWLTGAKIGVPCATWGCPPPPPPLKCSKGRYNSFERVKYPRLPTRIGKRYCQTIFMSSSALAPMWTQPISESVELPLISIYQSLFWALNRYHSPSTTEVVQWLYQRQFILEGGSETTLETQQTDMSKRARRSIRAVGTFPMAISTWIFCVQNSAWYFLFYLVYIAHSISFFQYFQKLAVV